MLLYSCEQKFPSPSIKGIFFTLDLELWGGLVTAIQRLQCYPLLVSCQVATTAGDVPPKVYCMLLLGVFPTWDTLE